MCFVKDMLVDWELNECVNVLVLFFWKLKYKKYS